MSATRPIFAYQSTLLAGQGVGQSAAITVTFNIPNAWEAHIPVRAVQGTNVSAGPEVRVYRSCDGGVTFENEPLVAGRLAFQRTSGGDKTVALRLDSGQYVIQLWSGGPSTATFFIYTQAILTAVETT